MDYLSMPDITVEYSYIWWIVIILVIIVAIVFIVAFAGLTATPTCKDENLIVTNVNAQPNNQGSYYLTWNHTSTSPINGFKANIYNSNGNKINTLDIAPTDTYVTVSGNDNRSVGIQAYKIGKNQKICIGREVRVVLPQ